MEPSPPQPLRIIAVHVGRPALLGTLGGKEVLSGISKHRVHAGAIELRPPNLDGDEQADTAAHGGPDKAIYLYPAEHYPLWRRDGYLLHDGGVGENLTLSGASEESIRIGDSWAWGEAIIQVTQPREPCYKLGMHAGDKSIIARMIDTGRCGFYARVLEPATVPTRGVLEPLGRAPHDVTVAEVFRMLTTPTGRLAGAGITPSRIENALRVPELAESARRGLRKALARLERQGSGQARGEAGHS
ncbi:MOSC domain-containing protein [Hoyosella sp. G463]|uniref:MOSC domain-containing protein n=1 Tax=Lolliginicoccus lacisalsi TaxID=2742202 RepID=A0A927JE66_9ACTN|nr:MOSC domain-containing protein [Lolliginicoccus lacisalsi]